jgi:hypothetical protein
MDAGQLQRIFEQPASFLEAARWGIDEIRLQLAYKERHKDKGLTVCFP